MPSNIRASTLGTFRSSGSSGTRSEVRSRRASSRWTGFIGGMLPARSSHRVREIAAGNRARFVAAHAVGHERHRHAEIGIAPADGAAEAAVPEGAGGARRAGPVATGIGQTAEFEAEPAADRHLE